MRGILCCGSFSIPEIPQISRIVSIFRCREFNLQPILFPSGIDKKCFILSRECLNLLGSYSYDLIFMDIRMPEMDGLEACQRLREMGIKTPVIALTADAMKGDKERFIIAGMNGYLSKPLLESKLAAVLRETLSSDTGPDFKEFAEQSYPERAALDIETFLSVLGGDVDAAKSLLRDFKDWGGKLLALGHNHLERDEMEQAMAVYHQLSGAAHSVQAVELAEIALELELLLKNGDTGSEELVATAEALNHAFDRLVEKEESLNWVI